MKNRSVNNLCQRLFSLLLALLLMISGFGSGLVPDAHAEGSPRRTVRDRMRFSRSARWMNCWKRSDRTE